MLRFAAKAGEVAVNATIAMKNIRIFLIGQSDLRV